MTFTEHLLDGFVLLMANYEQKTDKTFEKAETARERDNIVRARALEQRGCAYRAIAEDLRDLINASTLYLESLENLKKYCQQYGVTSWLEAGVNVLDVGDAYLGNDSFSRLDRYHKDGALEFCGYCNMHGSCGMIVLGNGRIICYNVIPESEHNKYYED